MWKNSKDNSFIMSADMYFVWSCDQFDLIILKPLGHH